MNEAMSYLGAAVIGAIIAWAAAARLHRRAEPERQWEAVSVQHHPVGIAAEISATAGHTIVLWRDTATGDVTTTTLTGRWTLDQVRSGGRDITITEDGVNA